jgi:hypothetical protein
MNFDLLDLCAIARLQGRTQIVLSPKQFIGLMLSPETGRRLGEMSIAGPRIDLFGVRFYNEAAVTEQGLCFEALYSREAA